MPVLGNQFCKLCLTHQFTITQPRYTLCRHDGSNWRCNDQERASQGDESLGIKMALVHIKSDWAEHCGTLGFPSWTSGLRPCLFCTASTHSWFTTDGLDSQRFLFHLNTHGDCKTACATCVIVVLVDSAAHARILPLLGSNNRASGCHGRCLLEDIPELNLRTDDRHGAQSRVAQRRQFRRRRPSGRNLNRRSPSTGTSFFSKTLGVTLPQTVTVDILHTLH